jgi:hypothetical protein
MIMKIRVHVAEQTPLDSFSLQIFDRYYAYKQSLNKNNNYEADCEIKVGKNMQIEPDAINIGFYYMPAEPIDATGFDLIIVDGQQHHLEVCTPDMYRAFVELNNCYFLTGAVFDDNYPGADRILSFPNGNIFLHDFLTRSFYPQYYDRLNQKTVDTKHDMIFINGQNRPHRQYMIDLLRSTVGPAVTVRQNTYTVTTELEESFFETHEDTKFRHYVNANCSTLDPVHQETKLIGQYSINVGIDQKFGHISPAHFVIDEYYHHHCVIFPESTWLNDEICITEKLQKCAVARTIPWPIAGANADVLYKQLGYQTAWNLLPEQLQSYNYERDHVKRYQMCADAIKWMTEHPEILTSDRARELVEHNYNLFFSNTIEIMGPVKLDQILQRYAK